MPIRIEVAWDKLVFGCLSHKAPPFREWIAPLADRYDSYKFDTYTRYHRDLDQEYPINWKAFAENSNDDYHVRFVHRRLNSQRKSLDTVVRFAGRTCSGYKPHPDGVDLTDGRTDLDQETLRGPLRRLHLPQPHAAALPDGADHGPRRPDRARPHPAVLTDLRPEPHAGAAGGRPREPRRSPTARTPTW